MGEWSQWLELPSHQLVCSRSLLTWAEPKSSLWQCVSHLSYCWHCNLPHPWVAQLSTAHLVFLSWAWPLSPSSTLNLWSTSVIWSSMLLVAVSKVTKRRRISELRSVRFCKKSSKRRWRRSTDSSSLTGPLKKKRKKKTSEFIDFLLFWKVLWMYLIYSGITSIFIKTKFDVSWSYHKMDAWRWR